MTKKVKPEATVKQTREQALISERLIFYFKKSGMTQLQLSQESDVAECRISEYLNIHKNPSVPTLKKLTDALNVSWTKFFRTDQFDQVSRKPKTVQN